MLFNRFMIPKPEKPKSRMVEADPEATEAPADSVVVEKDQLGQVTKMTYTPTPAGKIYRSIEERGGTASLHIIDCNEGGEVD